MRSAREIMAELAATGMTPDQIALVMELSAAVSAEARPVADEAAERRRERDREYQAAKRAERRQISADSADTPLDKKDPHTPKKINPQAPPIVPPKRVSSPAKPDDVSEQTWVDWLALRKAKRAPVSPSVIDGARREAGKLGWTLEAFLAEWVMRGSQGLKADWITPARAPPNGQTLDPMVTSILARQKVTAQ